MPSPSYGTSTAGLPFTMGAPPASSLTFNITQTFLTQSVVQPTTYVFAADVLFDVADSNEATHNFVIMSVTHTMLDDESGYDQELNIVQYIGLVDRHFHDAFNNVGFNDAAVMTEAYDCSNSFDWIEHDDIFSGDPLALVQAHLATNSMLTDSVSQSFQYDAENFFDLADVISTGSTNFERDGNQLACKQHLTFSITGAKCNTEKEYAPQLGSSDDSDYGNISPTAPTLTTGVLTLTHPRVSPTTTLVLRNPEFGNTDSLEFAKIDRVTRGGDRKIFAEQDWGETQSFKLTVRNLCELDVSIDEILDFMNTSLGAEIGLLDWEGRNWKGIIVAPESDVTSDVNGYRVEIIFEGELS